MKNFKTFLLLFAVSSLLFVVLPVQAQEMNNLVENLVTPTPLVRADLISIIFKVIRYVLGFLGVVAVVILIYGGFVWMTAHGNEEQVRKAKKIIINGLIGLVVVLLSYAIVSFAIGKVQEVGRPPGQVCTPGECCGPCRECSVDGNACDVYNPNCPPCGGGGGSFVVRWTYPRNQEENISVCALLQAGFNDELDETTINETNIKITLRDALKVDGESCQENKECKSGKCENNVCIGNVVAGTFTVVRDVFKFDNEVDFEKETWYRFLITTGVRSTRGRNLASQRSIEFKTGSEEDTTPPIVKEVYPPDNEENVCLLDPIQSVFSEPMDVTTLLNVESLKTDPLHEFNHSVPNVETLNATPKSSYQKFTRYRATLNSDIIADVCGNKLDGNENGQAEGSPIDDYSWSFQTGDTLYCEPVIDSITPTSGYYNDELTIRGNYFRLSGEVIFNRSVYPNDFCFNNDNFPNQDCSVKWSNREIKIKVPAAGGNSQGAVSGPVYVVVGEIPSNTKYFSLESPYIQSFTPNQGGRGQAITLRGRNFGEYLEDKSQVYFINQVTLRRTKGDLICGEVGWKDYEIIVAVPQLIDLGNYYLQVQTKDGKYSNVRLDDTFEITNQQPGPILCDITPYCSETEIRGGKPGDDRTFDGSRFGTEQGKVIFDSKQSEIISWTDDKIKIKVPEISAGTYQARVVLPNFQESNPLTFVSPCFERSGLGGPCFLDEQRCTIEKCLSPYECKESSDGLLECRCCCSTEMGCPNPNLECDETQICYKNRACVNFKNETDCNQQRGCYWTGTLCKSIEITGICCGCDEKNPCSQNEICKQKGENAPFCCYACEIGDDGQPCVGGQCCSKNCEGLSQDECIKHEGCEWKNLTCQGSYSPYCCYGRCVDHQCLSLCGNGRIDPGEVCDPGDFKCSELNEKEDCEKREGCKWKEPVCERDENLNNKTCQSLGYEGGTLHCQKNCDSFDVSNCIGTGSGYWGEVCRREDIPGLNCLSGKKDCLNALGADCVKNVKAICACCCRPDYPGCAKITNQEDCQKDFRCEWQDNTCKSKGDSCDLINPKLSCDVSQPCGESGQKGLCCGCDVDEDCNNGQGFACKNGCCYPFPPPKELKVISAEKEKIQLKWRHEDKNQLTTHFEIWKKDPGETEFTLLTTCEMEDFNGNGNPRECEPDSGKFILEISANLYKFEDKRGNFERGKEYSYKVRAKKGSQTAYSLFTEPATGKVTGIVKCNVNSDCPDEAPCCREDTQVCVDWENCQGKCNIDDRCQPPAIKFATHDFWVTKEKEIGPCLIKVTPYQGYICEPNFTEKIYSVVLSGLNFKNERRDGEGVFFNGVEGKQFDEVKEACEGCGDDCEYKSWEDEKIEIQYTPAAEAQTGLVKVKKIIDDGKELWSNGREFKVLRRRVGVGSACVKNYDGCRRAGGICDPVEVYPCIECNCSLYNNKEECQKHFPYCEWSDINNKCDNVICEAITNQTECEQYSKKDEPYCQWKPWRKCVTNKAHCRCCCDPSLGGPDDPCKKLNDKLECYANQAPCTGPNRGLCCGCQKDDDCNLSGDEYGCDLGNPRCCRPRPVLSSTSFCSITGSENTSPENVPLNTAITLTFNQKMDFGSLSEENIKISREGKCEIGEGETKISERAGARCYLYGTIINTNKGNETQSIFMPKPCKLKTSTIYTIEMVIGKDGQGVRSEKGVSMDRWGEKCSWDQEKQCYSSTFKTTADENILCYVDWIEVQPGPEPVVVRKANVSTTYYGIARDENNIPICVSGFSWSSSNNEIATVKADEHDPKKGIATSQNKNGEAVVIAAIPSLNKTCYTKHNSQSHTCGRLKVILAGPQVIEQRGCETCDLGGQSPSPYIKSLDACLNAQITATFSRSIKPETLNNDNIKVRQCLGSEIAEPGCEKGKDISGTISMPGSKPTELPKSTKKFYFKPTNPLVKNTIYQVTLKSGPNGIKDTEGHQLDGNRNGLEEGSPIDDYVWLFKTKDDDSPCQLTEVCIFPPEDKKICLPGRDDCSNTQTYNAEIYTTNCNYLKAENYSWSWQSLPLPGWQPPVARVVPYPTSTAPTSTAVSENLGLTYIKATAIGTDKSDQAKLIVATTPKVEEKYPQGENLCRNIAIYALFDQEMDENSIKNNFKIEEESENKTNEFSIRFEKENNKTKVYFIPQGFLKANKKYTVTILSNVTSKTPFFEKMGKEEKWNFTTSDYICHLEKVKIDPEEYVFTKARDHHEFNAKALSFRDPQNPKQEIQPIPGLYEWEWNWRSSDNRIVTVTRDEHPEKAIAESRANGLATIIAQAKITEDKIFVPSTKGQFKEGAAQIEVWLCDNPWPSTDFPEAQTYDDKLTNFSFRYCRDAGNPGLDGDLPILKGGPSPQPPVEPGLSKLSEHFFTVYDGSLSFLYNEGPIITDAKTGKRYFVNKSGYNNLLYNIFGDNNASIRGNISEVTGGKFGNALSFNDRDSYLSVSLIDDIPYGRNMTIEPDKFSLEAWIKMKKPTVSTPPQYLFKKDIDTSIPGQDGMGYSLVVKDDAKVYFQVFDQQEKKAEASTELFGESEMSEDITSPKWTHLAATYDGKNLKLYINGEIKATASTPNGGISQSESNLLIGQNFVGLLDEIAFWQKALTQQEIRAHLKKPISPTLGDALGFKVFANFEHLKPEEWYKKYAPGIEGSGASNIVDGYKSYQVGRTVYVGATNVDKVDNSTSFPKIYTNIYLLSQSDNPNPETSQVFRQSINNWRFNINVEDTKKETPINEAKAQLARDLERIQHLREIWKTLEKYQTQNTHERGFYPRLDKKGGTYIKGMSTSKWPSWTAKTGLGRDLTEAGLSPLPVDPINKFEKRKGCGSPPTLYDCCANCPSYDPDCSQTCYNPQEFKYECYRSADKTINSQIYQYMAEGNPVGKEYGLYANFEFTYPDNWQHQCEGLSESLCQERAFCYWEGGGSQSYLQDKFIITAAEPRQGECKPKILNYEGNPCKNLNMNCACFNTKFSSVIREPAVPPQINFTASRYWVYEGEPVTLSWSVIGGTECNASSDPAHSDWNGSVSPTSGSKMLNLDKSTLFTLSCSGLGGSRSQAQLQINVLKRTYTLNVLLAGNGSGFVSSDPPGISCQPDCDELYESNKEIILTATPAENSKFDGWTGACSGTNPTCQLTMDEDKSTTATFNLITTLPDVSTDSATNITSNEANLNGKLISLGSSSYVDVKFEWGLTPSYGNSTSWQRMTSVGPFSALVYGLNPGRNYHFRAVARDDKGNIKNGDDKTFSTYAYTGDAYVANYDDHNVLKININNLSTTIIPLGGSSDDPRAICITPNKEFIFVTDDKSGDENIYKIRTSDNKIVASVATGSSPDSCAVTPDGQYLIVGLAGSSDRVIKYSVSDLEYVYAWTNDSRGNPISNPEDIVITPDGQYAFLTAGSGSSLDLVRILLSNHSSDGVTLYNNLQEVTEPDGIALSRDGRYLYLTSSGNDRIGIFEITSGNINYKRYVTTCDNPKWAIAISPDNQYLFVGCPGSNSHNVTRYLISGDNLINPSSASNIKDAEYDLAITPDGSYIIILSSSNDTIYRYQLSSWPGTPSITSTYINNPQGVCIK